MWLAGCITQQWLSGLLVTSSWPSLGGNDIGSASSLLKSLPLGCLHNWVLVLYSHFACYRLLHLLALLTLSQLWCLELWDWSLGGLGFESVNLTYVAYPIWEPFDDSHYQIARELCSGWCICGPHRTVIPWLPPSRWSRGNRVHWVPVGSPDADPSPCFTNDPSLVYNKVVALFFHKIALLGFSSASVLLNSPSPRKYNLSFLVPLLCFGKPTYSSLMGKESILESLINFKNNYLGSTWTHNSTLVCDLLSF